MDDTLFFEYKKGKRQIFPAHKYVRSWLFDDSEEEEALLAHQIAKVAEKNGLTKKETSNVFPFIVRMLKGKVEAK